MKANIMKAASFNKKVQRNNTQLVTETHVQVKKNVWYVEINISGIISPNLPSGSRYFLRTYSKKIILQRTQFRKFFNTFSIVQCFFLCAIKYVFTDQVEVGNFFQIYKQTFQELLLVMTLFAFHLFGGQLKNMRYVCSLMILLLMMGFSLELFPDRPTEGERNWKTWQNFEGRYFEVS